MRAALVAEAGSHAGSEASRRRAAWILALLAPPGDVTPDQAEDRRPLSGEPAPQRLTQLLRAREHARRGDYVRALHFSDSLTEASADELGDPQFADPFFRTVLHLLRADWYLSARPDSAAAQRELLWYQNNDVYHRPTGPPQAGDADWAFGTLARWRLAALYDRQRQRDQACRAYGDIQRLWGGGDPRYRARADTARHRFAALQCPVRP